MTKKYLVLLTFLFPIFLFGQENNISGSVIDKFAQEDLSNVQTIKDLAKSISILTVNKQEQLQMLLLWSQKYMAVDSNRFFKGGNPLTSNEAFSKRIALCDEFSAITAGFCKELKIPSFRIEGYVKYLDFKPGNTFNDGNHVWNAVYVNSTWLLCDLFWSTYVLKVTGPSSHFLKRLNTRYFLTTSNTFIVNHFPLDSVFQFDNYPIKLNSFTSVPAEIDLSSSEVTINRMPYQNYSDSLKLLLNLNASDRSLLIAKHAYSYNKDNPNVLIAEFYNYGGEILNNKASSKLELKRAKSFFSSALDLIEISKNEDIKELKEDCKRGLQYAVKRLNTP